MNVKRYLAEDAAEAMKKVREELGLDAVILNTRHIKRKGFFGFLKKPMVEVVAAYESPVYRQATAVTAPVKIDAPPRGAPEADTAPPPRREEASFGDALTGEARLNPSSDEIRDNRIRSLEEKLDSVTMLIKDMSVRLDAPFLEEGRAPLPPQMEQIRKQLLEQEVHSEVLVKLLDTVVARMATEDEIDPAEAVEEYLLTLLANPEPLDFENDGRKIVLLAGPTGVGKTTTLAKLAARYALGEGKKVGIITTDTFRIAAVEQLKTYAEIMELPIEIAYSADEIPALLDGYKDCDVVFIDTAGRSPTDAILEEETKELIEKSGADEVYLVLSATTSFAGCLRILDTYSFLTAYKLIFTKLDESPNWGIVPNVRFLTEKPLSYLSVGQRVPDDLEVADATKIADRLLGRKQV
ncbi:flagellar biosynthesis protein FlhF [Oscillospiraceae bacterium OttesenSCG-928-G22]|nr:flagellar biosynthesis protein FlhF [Oscillospiraceae bacterium OttesenSCG-928-G22]